jgi:hypothetical protein
MSVDEIDLLRNDVLSNRSHRPKINPTTASERRRRQMLAMSPGHHLVIGCLGVQERADFGGAAQLFQCGTKIDDDALFAVVAPTADQMQDFHKKVAPRLTALFPIAASWPPQPTLDFQDQLVAIAPFGALVARHMLLPQPQDRLEPVSGLHAWFFWVFLSSTKEPGEPGSPSCPESPESKCKMYSG